MERNGVHSFKNGLSITLIISQLILINLWDVMQVELQKRGNNFLLPEVSKNAPRYKQEKANLNLPALSQVILHRISFYAIEIIFLITITTVHNRRADLCSPLDSSMNTCCYQLHTLKLCYWLQACFAYSQFVRVIFCKVFLYCLILHGIFLYILEREGGGGGFWIPA